MRVKKFDRLLQVRVSETTKRQLDEAADRFEINLAALVRLSLQTGLRVIERKLPMAENER
jgi:hypothetical protein